MFDPSTSPVDVQQTPETDMDTNSDTGSELPTAQAEEGEFSNLEQDVSVTDTNQASTEEQNYRETMRGVRSYIGWTHIPHMDINISSAEDNPFAAPKQQPVSKVSVNLPTDDWLCRKMDGLNLTLAQRYPSRSSKTGRLQRDQFLKHSKSHVKWYRLHSSQDRPTRSVSFWHWKKAARESAHICNQATGLSRCLSNVKQGMQTQLRVLQTEQTKEKSAGKVGAATEELQYQMNFSTSIIQCMAKAMEHLLDCFCLHGKRDTR